MSCFHPLKGFKVGYHPSGKPNYKITSYDTIYVSDRGNDNLIPCTMPTSIDNMFPKYTESIDIPCGHCIGCYLDRSRQWADRCMLEAMYHDANCFITLTYDDEHLPKPNDVFDSDGVAGPSPLNPLCKKDFQDFMKRLRSRIEPIKVRMFACGEYGSKNFRPHYHAIIFGYDFPDRQFYKKNFSGDDYFTSELLNSVWNKGIAIVANLDWNCAAYVSRYCLKKRNNDLDDFYEEFSLTPEFILMSRKPGIAREYYEDHKNDIYKTESIFIFDSKGSKQLRPPHYFDKLYDIDYPSDMERIKQHRKLYADNKKIMELERTDLDYLDYLKVKEYNLTNKANIFNERSLKL